MYRTLKEGGGECPVCGAPTVVDERLTVIQRCKHFVRVWRVSSDRRVRVEYREPKVAA